MTLGVTERWWGYCLSCLHPSHKAQCKWSPRKTVFHVSPDPPRGGLTAAGHTHFLSNCVGATRKREPQSTGFLHQREARRQTRGVWGKAPCWGS